MEVVAVAKENLKKGAVLDEIGGYKTYGICENSGISRSENLLPMALANKCKLLRDVPKDQVLTFDDVDATEHELVYDLWIEQKRMFLD